MGHPTSMHDDTPARALWIVHSRHQLPRWTAELLTKLSAESGLKLCQVTIAETPADRTANSWNQLINALDSALFPGADSASVPADSRELPEDLFTRRSHSTRLTEMTLAPGVHDLVLNVSTHSDTDIASSLGRTVWSLRYGNGRAPIGLEECLDGHTYIDLSVVATDPVASQCRVIASATECTDPVSIGRTRNAALWAGTELLRHTLQAWHDVADLDGTAEDVVSEQPRAPNAWTALFRVPAFFAEGVKRKLARRGLLRQWILLWKPTTDDAGSDPAPTDFDQWHRLLPPRDVFWADPFPVTREGKQVIFIEEATFSPRRGHLSVLEIGECGSVSNAVPILKKPYHLSYPNVFEHEGQWYMMPESGEDRSLQLYRCERWPDTWVWQKNLLEGIAVFDGTLLRHNGSWWLFATVQHVEGASPNVFLHVWQSDSPLGPWHPHKANPVVSDVRSARPAGNFFIRDNVLYRPSQNCSTHYGFGLQINRVDQLDEHGYSETCVSSHTPWAPDIEGVHTLNSATGITVSDAIHWRSPDS